MSRRGSDELREDSLEERETLKLIGLLWGLCLFFVVCAVLIAKAS
jgi:hypothetical protein